MGRRGASIGRLACGLALPLLMGAPAEAVPPQPVWRTGPSLQRQLQQPIGIAFSGLPLREALYGLGRKQGVAVLLDRRIDPGRPVELRLEEVALEDVFRQIAARHGMGYALVGPVAYFGPAEAAARLPALAALQREESRRMPSAAKLLKLKALGWDEFASPRHLLVELGEESGLKLSGLEQVPHDLWAAADLPPLCWVDRVTLIAVQFGLTFQLAAAGDALSLVRIPADVAPPRSPPGDRPRQSPAPVGKAGKVHKGQPEERYTVARAKGPPEVLLRQLAERFGLELKIDREALDRAGISLQQPVAFSVTEATMDELFEALLKPAGCTFRRQGNVLEVGPAK